jgi:PadR family transcriptional regulator, regulatory protein PadR
MPGRESPLQSEMVQGTLDMLILKTLLLGPAHGQTIAHAIERGSEDVLQVEHGSLYPALHRLQNRGWIAAFWGTSENNRKAKYYRLTPLGRKQLAAQQSRWDQLVRAIGRIMNPTAQETK